MELTQFTISVIQGLMLGAAYGLMGAGLSLIYGQMNIVNFAHGEYYMIGAFLQYTLVAILNINFWLALVITILIMAILSALTDKLIFSQIRNSPIIITALVTVGLSVFLTNNALIIWGGVPKNVVPPGTFGVLSLGEFINVPYTRIFVLIVGIATTYILHMLTTRTKFGLAFRSTFEDKDAAALVGIKIQQIYLVTTILGLTVAGIAGVLLGTVYLIYPTMGGFAVLKAFTVAIIGGFGSFLGAFYTGLMLGVVESLAAGFISTTYKDVIGFVLIIVFLLIRPKGLFGER